MPCTQDSVGDAWFETAGPLRDRRLPGSLRALPARGPAALTVGFAATPVPAVPLYICAGREGRFLPPSQLKICIETAV